MSARSTRRRYDAPVQRAARFLALSIALASTGCVRISDFEPVGGTAAIAGSWTIDGAAPTEESCKDLVRSYDGSENPPVPRVRATFVDNGRAVPHGALVFDCAAGSFDTMESLVVAEGIWNIRLEAIDSVGHVVAFGPETMQDAAAGRIDLPPTDFPSSVISVRTLVNGVDPTQPACDAAGIDHIILILQGPSAASVREPCAAGGAGRRVLPGTYTVQLHVFDSANALIGETAPMPVDVPQGVQATIGTGDPLELTAL